MTSLKVEALSCKEKFSGVTSESAAFPFWLPDQQSLPTGVTRPVSSLLKACKIKLLPACHYLLRPLPLSSSKSPRYPYHSSPSPLCPSPLLASGLLPKSTLIKHLLSLKNEQMWTLERHAAASLLPCSAPPGYVQAHAGAPRPTKDAPLCSCQGLHRQPAQSEPLLPQPDPECQKAERLLDESEDNGNSG